MRTTADLVAELRDAAAGAEFAALVVAFGDHTRLVWAGDPTALKALNAHLRGGGAPVGVLRHGPIAGDGSASLEVRPLAECAGHEGVEEYLLTVLGAFRAAAREQGIAAGSVGAAGPAAGGGALRTAVDDYLRALAPPPDRPT